MSNDHTLFGFDRLARAEHRGNVGIKTGSISRPGGKQHLFNRETGRTVCGIARGQMTVTLVPAIATEETWPVRIALCNKCRKAVGA